MSRCVRETFDGRERKDYPKRDEREAATGRMTERGTARMEEMSENVID